eukprot:m.29155 g.29155  ORF g.29155 m.29155 type:complete len:368 (+) comp4634_c0_seq2:335-1438(+)
MLEHDEAPGEGPVVRHAAVRAAARACGLGKPVRDAFAVEDVPAWQAGWRGGTRLGCTRVGEVFEANAAGLCGIDDGRCGNGGKRLDRPGLGGVAQLAGADVCQMPVDLQALGDEHGQGADQPAGHGDDDVGEGCAVERERKSQEKCRHDEKLETDVAEGAEIRPRGVEEKEEERVLGPPRDLDKWYPVVSQIREEGSDRRGQPPERAQGKAAPRDEEGRHAGAQRGQPGQRGRDAGEAQVALVDHKGQANNGGGRGHGTRRAGPDDRQQRARQAQRRRPEACEGGSKSRYRGTPGADSDDDGDVEGGPDDAQHRMAGPEDGQVQPAVDPFACRGCTLHARELAEREQENRDRGKESEHVTDRGEVKR